MLDYLSDNEADKWFFIPFYVRALFISLILLPYCHTKISIEVFDHTEESNSKVGQETETKKTNSRFGIMVILRIVLYGLSWTLYIAVQMLDSKQNYFIIDYGNNIVVK